MSTGLISVVLPACEHSLSPRIGHLLGQYVAALEGLGTPFELLPVVSRTAVDATQETCVALAQREPRIRVLSVDNGTWGRAVQQGLSEARGDLLCYTNSVRTSASDLATVLSHGLSSPESVIKANRRIRDGIVPRLGSLLYVIECRALFDLAYWDVNGTPKVFPRQFHKLLTLRSQDDLVDLEFDVVCRREGYPVLEVALPTVHIDAAAPRVSLASAWRMYIGAYRLRRQMGAQ